MADAEAKQFKPNAETATVYINQDGAVPTSAPCLFWTAVDGKRIAPISCRRYQILSIPPGQHAISVIGMDHVEEENLLAEAGKIYFFNITAQRGWMSIRPKLKKVDDSAGHKLVNRSKRADTKFSSPEQL
jgi:hypothetical protein